jgi:hypothetical protein
MACPSVVLWQQRASGGDGGRRKAAEAMAMAKKGIVKSFVESL